MADDAQVGDTVRLTITVEGVVGKWKGEEHVMGYTLAGIDRTVEILSRATPPLPSEPGTMWLDNEDSVWRVGLGGSLNCLDSTLCIDPLEYAPFRQLVLK